MEGHRGFVATCFFPHKERRQASYPLHTWGPSTKGQSPSCSLHSTQAVSARGALGHPQPHPNSPRQWSGKGTICSAHELLKHSSSLDPSLLGLSWWKQPRKHSCLQLEILDHLQNKMDLLSRAKLYPLCGRPSSFSRPPALARLNSG